MRTFIAAAICAVPIALSAQTADVAIIPRPVSLTRGSGSFTFTARTQLFADRADSAVAERFARSLAAATGFTLPVRIGRATSGNRIVFQRAASTDTTLGEEGYRLDVKPSVVTVTSTAPAGAFYATQSIRQLLPAEVFRAAPVDAKQSWTIPAVSIVDRPRFPYRGMHLDVARHFMPKEFVKKYIDLLALHKMNRFHWHLTDDQGWRLEIKKYPRLTEVGAWRDSTIIGHMVRDTLHAPFDRKRHGGFYTQDDVREVVAYAAERFVTIVPEIEMPGHAQAAISAYPSLGNFGDTIRPWTMWGVTNYILNPSDTTIAFMQDVLTEVMQVFPGSMVHIGGDEAPKPQWRSSPRAQHLIDALNLRDPGDTPTAFKSEDRLQSWFTTQMHAFLSKRGRRLIGWDEILDGGLAPNAVVMSWRGLQGGITAARAGHDVIMTPNAYTYFDHYQAPSAAEPLAIGGFLPIDSVYLYEPVPADLEPQFAKHILGAQAQVWTEYLEGPKNVEYMAYPRAAALAEVLWTPPNRRDLSDFKKRLADDERRLNALDVNYRP
ncbi:MAG TPA: beta-N-acetylhexosaminidase [Gemmatimonadaceae bacterium]|jgi:hexosaminidase